ncbi:hypothetical protein Bbelb_199580 [Branchiostoma belcheri]|nr:hypothetical protein Bbelb_199580 [Branchiostoma belcheri]
MLNAIPVADLVYLELGHNDLCDTYWEPDLVAMRIVSLATLIRNRASAQHIIIGEPLARVYDPPGIPYNQTLPVYLSALRKEVNDTSHMSTWANVRLVRKHCPEFFADDGLHLSAYGNLLYYKSIRGALAAANHTYLACS